MEIGSGQGYPASALSNFTHRSFVFDGVECASMEGFLQALKFENPEIQKEVCKLAGIGAKRRGSKRNKAWKSCQTLWWNGVAYKRKGKEYKELIERAYDEMFKQNEKLRDALKASGQAVFTHSIGKTKEQDTVLTIREFCGNLTRLRGMLAK